MILQDGVIKEKERIGYIDGNRQILYFWGRHAC
jgi:hypothetical protein